MPKRTVNDRLRQRLHDLLRTKTFSKSGLADYCKKPASWVSGFLHQGRGIRLDDLDEIAAYFQLSIGELLGVSKPGELNGDEQRAVHALRTLSPALRAHVLAVMEGLSVSVRLRPPDVGSRQRLPPELTHASALPASSGVASPVEQRIIDEVARVLADLLRDRPAGERPAGNDAPIPPPRPSHRQPLPKNAPKADQ